MGRPLPLFLSTVVFLRALFYLQPCSYFSLTIFSTALLTLFTLMLMTQLYILLLISNLLPLLLLELLLVFFFPILFLLICMGLNISSARMFDNIKNKNHSSWVK